MFEGLKSTLAVEPEITTVVSISEEAFEALIDNQADVPARRIALMQHNTTKTELAALISSIEAFGLSRSLLSFANHDGALGGAVPNIPALESLTDDLSTESSTAVVATLKQIKLADLRFEPAGESLLIAGAALWAVVNTTVGIVSFIATCNGFKHWNTTANDKAGRLAKVIPYKNIKEYLEGIAKITSVAHELSGMMLPKTEEAYAAFKSKVDSIAAPLSEIGVHIKGLDVKADAFPVAVKNNIETLGYHENSLAEIVELVETAKTTLESIKSVKFDALNEQLEAAAKGEAKNMADDGLCLIVDVVDTAARRASKILRLVKSTVGSIKHFYAKDAGKPAEAPKD